MRTVFGFAILVTLLTAGAAQGLSGSNTVTSDDIVDGQIYNRDIHDGAVNVKKLAASARPVYALVNGDQRTFVPSRSSGAVSVVSLGVGVFEVKFNRNVSNCSVQLTPRELQGVWTGGAWTNIENAAIPADSVRIAWKIYLNQNWVSNDPNFFVLVVC